jgi:hypothetical protein
MSPQRTACLLGPGSAQQRFTLQRVRDKEGTTNNGAAGPRQTKVRALLA